MSLYDITDVLIRKASYKSPITAKDICSYLGDAKTEEVTEILKEAEGQKLPLGVTIREKDSGYYADLPFCETDIFILHTALLGLPYCEWRQMSEMSERLNEFLPEYMREQADSLQTGSEQYSGTFYENMTEIVKAIYPMPDKDNKRRIKKVIFKYNKYNEYAELVPYNNNVTDKVVNPIKVICMNNYFYLVVYYRDSKTDRLNFKNYRIDRMSDVRCSDEYADDFEEMMNSERRETLDLKRKLDKERSDAHKEGRIYFEPKADISALDVSQRIDVHGFNLGEYIQRSKWMFTDEIYKSATIKSRIPFMNTIIDTFGFDIDVIERDDECATLRIYNVSQSSLVNLALQFVDWAEVLYTDEGDRKILDIISEQISKLSNKYNGAK